MSPELYFATMLITNPQKARRILLAEELENWFMDLFDEEFEDILNGTFKANQEIYIDKIVDKYLEITNVSITDKDEYSKSVIDKAFKTASDIQETTWKNLTFIPLNKKNERDSQIAESIKRGLAIGSVIFATEAIRRWLGQERANLIALNEANWKWNNEEFFDAKSKKKTKTWLTALDERVRFTHIALEGVTIQVDELFHVGNSLMLFPLDWSHGADANEIINCRCSVEYK